MTLQLVPISTAPKTWTWQTFSICYQQVGEQGPPVVLVHGFGASWGHWRKNLPALGQHYRCYAIDLLGFGGSAKPDPSDPGYTFATWGSLLRDFCQQVVGEPAFLIGNSIGCIVSMQTAAIAPDWVRGVGALNCSLRLLHERKRAALPWFRRVGAPIFQKILTNKIIGNFFFQQIATPRTVKNVLQQAYQRTETVTDELVEMLLKPAKDPGAVDVFLAFTGYSQGPLAEDLLPQLACPVLFLWGADDPWEPLELGQKLASFAAVEKFIPLPGLGHCPQDEAPEVVNPLLLEWLNSHTP
ncbi:MAG: alpha/beta fold hydrolase [Cyanobacteria bacterium P01_H01_bin.15]